MNARRLRGQQPTDRETIKRRLRRREVLDIPGGEMYGQPRHTDAIFFFFFAGRIFVSISLRTVLSIISNESSTSYIVVIFSFVPLFSLSGRLSISFSPYRPQHN